MASKDGEPGTPKPRFLTRTRVIILLVVAVAGVLAGRATVRFVLNLMLGGTMWGGNFL